MKCNIWSFFLTDKYGAPVLGPTYIYMRHVIRKRSGLEMV